MCPPCSPARSPLHITPLSAPTKDGAAQFTTTRTGRLPASRSVGSRPRGVSDATPVLTAHPTALSADVHFRRTHAYWVVLCHSTGGLLRAAESPFRIEGIARHPPVWRSIPDGLPGRPRARRPHQGRTGTRMRH